MSELVTKMQAATVPLQRLSWSIAERAGVEVWVKRADLVHPGAPGNKWYKLIENIRSMERHNSNGLLTFGGGYSNHLHAVALVGKYLGIPTIGIVRGSYGAKLTATLRDCHAASMTLEYVDRKQWQERNDTDYLKILAAKYNNPWIVPEGGSNQDGFSGARILGRELARDCLNMGAGQKTFFAACGTGTTFAGIVAELPQQVRAFGISVLKGEDTLSSSVARFLQDGDCYPECQWSVDFEWHCGGYAKYPTYLGQFVKGFEQECGFLLDPVYTAKVLFAVAQMLREGCFAPGEKLIVLHSGGLQGRRGFAGLNG